VEKATCGLTDRLYMGYNRIMERPDRVVSDIFRIVHGALRLDIMKVRNYTKFLADRLESEGDASTASRLRQLLEETEHELRPALSGTNRALPVDNESRFSLIEHVALKAIRDPSVVLTEPQSRLLNEFLSVAKSHAQLEAEGISTALSLLLYGPPGCGKTLVARTVARELGLDLYIARLDGLISSFLGSTSKNIRALFDFASRTPCVLFLDEFDAIAKLRSDQQELGELKRVVNSFIQNLDNLDTHSIVLAATNHEGLLDSAVWRRFSYRLELSYPDAGQRLQLWVQFLEAIRFDARELEVLVDLSDGFSGSDIRETSLRLHRKRITTRKQPAIHDAFDGLTNLATGEGEAGRFLAQIRRLPPKELASALRKRNPKLYSHSAIAALLGVSKATSYRWAGNGGNTNVRRP
jgi:SpoVK/Ycf46/Vps4 family AAA+-type ATPase